MWLVGCLLLTEDNVGSTTETVYMNSLPWSLFKLDNLHWISADNHRDADVYEIAIQQEKLCRILDRH